MLKNAVMATVSALLAAVALSAQPNKNATEKQTTAPQKNPPIILAAPNRENHGEANTTKPNTDPPASHTPFKDPNWVLVIVGSITCAVIAWQSWESRKAAQAARGGIHLQETLNQQWIEIAGWRKEGFGSRELNPPRFTIAAEIKNRTAAPLTIQKVWIGYPGHAPAEYEYRTTLAPHGEPIKVTFSGAVDSTPGQLGLYDVNHYPIILEGRVEFTDCFRKQQSQPFRRALWLGPGSNCISVAISEYASPVPHLKLEVGSTNDKKKDEERAN